MSSMQSRGAMGVKSFWTFTRHFLHYCFVLRGFLAAQFALMFLGGWLFSQCEQIPLSQGFYFALITSTTVGYGDITPNTGLGQCISVYLAFSGTILFGLIVAVATQAFTVTIDEYRRDQAKTASPS